MLASFRNVVRHKPILPSVHAVSFSSSSLRKQDGVPDSDGSNDFSDLLELGVSLQNNGELNYVFDPKSSWRDFTGNSFIRPDRLSYKSVKKTPAPPQSRPAVGPSKAEARKTDIFYLMDVDPLSQAMNPSMLNPFISEMGKIYGRNITKLTKKNQRRVGKAIRRAKMMGILPILRKDNIFNVVYSAKRTA